MPDFANYNQATQDSPLTEHAQIYALVGEVWMLVDYIAGSPSKGLNKIEVANPAKPGVNFTPGQLLQEVSDIERRIASGGQPRDYDRASMQVVRDALNLLIWPASGLTVAYTTIVTGPFRGRAASRVTLAKQAYANLNVQAVGHRIMHMLILTLTVVVMSLAVWQSAKVALGKALLQNLDSLRTQQAALSAEKVKLELSLATSAARTDGLVAFNMTGKVPLAFYRLCDRPLVARERMFGTDDHPVSRLLTFGTAEERDVCGRDDILRVNLGIVHQDLRTYSQNWPGMVGSGFAALRNLVTCRNVACPAVPVVKPDDGQNDIEFKIAPVLLVWGNFVLPIIFSFLGSAIFVMLDHYNKIRDSMLHPRDSALAPVRLVLGLVVGACVGLFFSAYGPVPQSTTPNASALVSSLTLTASGVAFLAGFGVETVFSLLEALIKKVFTLPSQAKP